MLHQKAIGLVGVVRPVTAQSGLPHDDNVWPDLSHFRKVYAPAGQYVAAEIGHENVAYFDQSQQDVPPFGGADIQGYPFLESLVVGLPGAARPGRDESHFIQHFVGLHLDDLGPQGSQDAPGQGQRHVGAKFNDSYPFQRLLWHLSPFYQSGYSVNSLLLIPERSSSPLRGSSLMYHSSIVNAPTIASRGPSSVSPSSSTI